MNGEEKLSNLSFEDQISTLKQFFVNMMDYTEQTKEEEIYITLYNALEEFTY